MITMDMEGAQICIWVYNSHNENAPERLKNVPGAFYAGDRYIVPIASLQSLREALRGFPGEIQQTDSFKDLIKMEKEGKLAPPKRSEQLGAIQMNIEEIDSDITIHVTNTYCRLSGKGIPHSIIEDRLKYFWKPALRMQRYKSGKWDGNICIYDRNRKEFPSGLLHRVVALFDARGIKYRIIGDNCLTPPTREFDWKFTDALTPAPDQVECINEIYKRPQCTIKCPTGFGKTSLIASKTIADYGLPSVYIANQNLLLYQAMDEFKANIVGLDEVGIIGDSECDIKPVTVASIQTVAMAFKIREIDEKIGLHLYDSCIKAMQEEIGYMTFLEQEHKTLAQYAARTYLAKADREVAIWYKTKMERYMVECKGYKSILNRMTAFKNRVENYAQVRNYFENQVKYIFFDECQSLGTDIWKLVSYRTNAVVRIAASATPKREDGADMEIEATSGPMVYQISAGELIDLGRLAELEVEFVPFDHELYNEESGVDIHGAEDEYIVHNETRNHLGISLLQELLAQGRSTIILAKRIEHGEILLNLCMESGISDVFHVHGSTKKDVKRDLLQGFGRGDFRVLIASTILDVGINIPRASGLLLMGAGSSEIRGPQRLGRIIRLFKLDPGKVAKAFDILDQNVIYFGNQAWKRYRNYRSEFEKKRVWIRGGGQRKKKREENEEVESYLGEDIIQPEDFQDDFQSIASGFASLFK